MKTNFPILPPTLFITGIDTDSGKSYATGWLAREANSKGQKAITQKLIQTGNQNFSEDIDIHRKIMGCELMERDLDHTTAPLILSYPASPDLSAKIDGVDINFSIAAKSTEILSSEYDSVLIEGAGGIMVPLKDNYLTIDYVAEHKLPTIVVTNGKLGSINHTLLTLTALKNRAIDIFALLYNPFLDTDPIIAKDTRNYLSFHLKIYHPSTLWIEMPEHI